MISTINHLVQRKDLLWAWTERTIRGRYQQSLLGGLWMIIQPAATVGIFSIIFTFFVPVDTGDIPYPVFSYVAVVAWMLLANSLTDMTISIVGNTQLITKIYFPRDILPISSILARLLDFFVAGGILLVLLLIYKVPAFPLGWLFLPIILIIQLALIVGLGLTLAAANVFYRDVQSLVTLGIQLWFYASPIIYPVTLVPENLLPIYNLNPMAGILESYRAILLYQTLPPTSLYLSAVISAIALIFGYLFFKKVEFQFADII